LERDTATGLDRPLSACDALGFLVILALHIEYGRRGKKAMHGFGQTSEAGGFVLTR
jgi:hypothetical protein